MPLLLHFKHLPTYGRLVNFNGQPKPIFLSRCIKAKCDMKSCSNSINLYAIDTNDIMNSSALICYYHLTPVLQLHTVLSLHHKPRTKKN